MLRPVVSAIVALALAAPFALPTGAQDGIGVYAGPFPSSFVDMTGGVSDADCTHVERTLLDNGTYYEVAYCTFVPGSPRPQAGSVAQTETTSERKYWSDYTYELTGGDLELATTWTVTSFPDGTLIAESTYGAQPLKDSDPFAGWVGSGIPDGNGGAILLSTTGVTEQSKYGLTDEQVRDAYDGESVTWTQGGVSYEGRLEGGVLVYWSGDSRLVDVKPADRAYIDSLSK